MLHIAPVIRGVPVTQVLQTSPHIQNSARYGALSNPLHRCLERELLLSLQLANALVVQAFLRPSTASV